MRSTLNERCIKHEAQVAMMEQSAAMRDQQDAGGNQSNQLKELQEENSALRGRFLQKQVELNFMKARSQESVNRNVLLDLELSDMKVQLSTAREVVETLTRQVAVITEENHHLKAASELLAQLQEERSALDAQLQERKQQIVEYQHKLLDSDKSSKIWEAKARETQALLEVSNLQAEMARKDHLAHISQLREQSLNKELEIRQLRSEISAQKLAMAEQQLDQAPRQQAELQAVVEDLRNNLLKLRTDFETERAQDRLRYEQKLIAAEKDAAVIAGKLADEQKTTALLEQLMQARQEAARSKQPAAELDERVAELQEEVRQLKRQKRNPGSMDLLRQQNEQLGERLEHLSEQVAKVTASQGSASPPPRKGRSRAARPLSHIPETSDSEMESPSPAKQDQATSRRLKGLKAAAGGSWRKGSQISSPRNKDAKLGVEEHEPTEDDRPAKLQKLANNRRSGKPKEATADPLSPAAAEQEASIPPPANHSQRGREPKQGAPEPATASNTTLAPDSRDNLCEDTAAPRGGGNPEENIAAPKDGNNLQEKFAASKDGSNLQEKFEPPKGGSDIEGNFAAPKDGSNLQEKFTAPKGGSDRQENFSAPKDGSNLQKNFEASKDGNNLQENIVTVNCSKLQEDIAPQDDISVHDGSGDRDEKGKNSRKSKAKPSSKGKKPARLAGKKPAESGNSGAPPANQSKRGGKRKGATAETVDKTSYQPARLGGNLHPTSRDGGNQQDGIINDVDREVQEDPVLNDAAVQMEEDGVINDVEEDGILKDAKEGGAINDIEEDGVIEDVEDDDAEKGSHQAAQARAAASTKKTCPRVPGAAAAVDTTAADPANACEQEGAREKPMQKPREDCAPTAANLTADQSSHPSHEEQPAKQRRPLKELSEIPENGQSTRKELSMTNEDQSEQQGQGNAGVHRSGAARSSSNFASDFLNAAGGLPRQTQRMENARNERLEDPVKRSKVATILSSMYVPPPSRKKLKDVVGNVKPMSSLGLSSQSLLGSSFRLPNLRTTR